MELCIIERRRWVDFIIINIAIIMGSVRLKEVDKAGNGGYFDERPFYDIDTCIQISAGEIQIISKTKEWGGFFFHPSVDVLSWCSL